MPEGEEAVESVFGVEVVIGPVAVEAAFGAPEGVDEIEAPPLLPCNEGEWAGARRAGDNAEGGQRASAGRG